MSNAADDLADILESWAIAEKRTTAGARTSDRKGGATLDYWREHQRALTLLAAVAEFVAKVGAQRPNPAHQSLILRCYQAVFGFQPNWSDQNTQSGEKSLMSEGDIGLLRTIGMVMEQGGTLIAPSDEAMLGIREGLGELRELLGDLTDLPAELRSYLIVLVGEAEQAIVDVEGFGYLTVRSKVAEIGGLVVSIVLSDVVADPEKQNRLAGLAKNLLGNVAGNLVASGAIAAGAGASVVLGLG